MISILIPVFNRNVHTLVTTLRSQADLTASNAEIIVMDDGSDTFFKDINTKLAHLPFVRYIESDKNYGRVLTRQKLAEAAAYPWLLFLDNDSTIVNGSFLETYLQYVNDTLSVVVGGRIYIPEKPSDCRLMLHWLYGSQREVSRFNDKPRSTNRFMTNNFFIHKNVFKKFDFTGEWSGYGYEDNWMALQLDKMKVKMIFIDNPVCHDGVETSVVFLEKSRKALKNLSAMSAMVAAKDLRKQVRLYDYFCLLKRYRIVWMIKLFHNMFANLVTQNLQSCHPSLLLFDLYRLGYFAKGMDARTTRA